MKIGSFDAFLYTKAHISDAIQDNELWARIKIFTKC